MSCPNNLISFLGLRRLLSLHSLTVDHRDGLTSLTKGVSSCGVVFLVLV